MRLPPRYGIITSNTSESANSMFLAPRSMPWLEATEKIIDIMTSCILTNTMKYIKKNPDDIVGVVEQKMKEEWDVSANLEAFELESGGGQVKVTSRGITAGAHNKSAMHLLWVKERWCSCGLWQDRGIPCRHFLVCLKNG